MKMVMAVIRTSCLESVIKSLEYMGIRGVSISEVKGIGEQVQLFKPYTIHSRIELVVPDEKTGRVSEIITEHAHTSIAGDGLVAVLPVDYMIKIRTKERIE